MSVNASRLSALALAGACLITPEAALAETPSQMPVGMAMDSNTFRIVVGLDTAAAWTSEEATVSLGMPATLDCTFWFGAGEKVAVGLSAGIGTVSQFFFPDIWSGALVRLGVDVRGLGRVHGYFGVGVSTPGVLVQVDEDPLRFEYSYEEAISVAPLVGVDLVEGGALQVRAGPLWDVRFARTGQPWGFGPPVHRLGVVLELVVYATGG